MSDCGRWWVQLTPRSMHLAMVLLFGGHEVPREPDKAPVSLDIGAGSEVKVDSWPIGLYRHPFTKTGRSRPYLNQFSSGLEGGQFMKPSVGWYTFKLWDRY